MRKSSIHFKPINNVRFATSHSERTDLSEPSYLLPKEHQLGNVIVSGSLPENELSALFIKQKEGMSRQAKTAGASPFWEGVLVLPNTNGREQEQNLKAWQKAYEKATGHKVLHMSIHLDEGYIDSAGKPQYNPHAHVILSRMDAQNRVINLDRKQLATVQDLTADALKMERGSTLEERQGRRGRKHIPHAEFRGMEDAKRQELVKQIAVMKEVHAREVGDLKGTIEKLKADYAKERQAMKESGEAKQADYQRLKREHEAVLAELKAEKQRNSATRQEPAKKPVEPPKPVAAYQPLPTAKERLYRLMDEIERGKSGELNAIGQEAYDRMKKGREQGKMDVLNDEKFKELHRILEENMVVKTPLEKAQKRLEMAMMALRKTMDEARESINREAARRGVSATPYPTNDQFSARHSSSYETAQAKAKTEREEANQALVMHLRQERPEGFFKRKETEAYDAKKAALSAKVGRCDVMVKGWASELEWRNSTFDKATAAAREAAERAAEDRNSIQKQTKATGTARGRDSDGMER